MEEGAQKTVKDILRHSEGSFITGDKATLLTPSEVYQQFISIGQIIGNEIRANRPTSGIYSTKRELVGISLYLKEQPPDQWTQSDIASQLAIIENQPIEDVRYHAAEAIGALLQQIDLHKQAPIISELLHQINPGKLNNQAVEALFRGHITVENQNFANLPKVIQQALMIRNGTASTSSIVTFLEENSQWSIDILQLAGKHLGKEVWLSDEIVNLTKDIVEMMKHDPNIFSNWKARTLLAVLYEYNHLDRKVKELYRQALEDPDEDVRIKMRDVFVDKVKVFDDRGINAWIDYILNDFNKLSEDKLRYIAHALVDISNYSSPEKIREVRQRLKGIARNHLIEYTRKTALKTLAKIGEDKNSEEVANFIIGSLQDDSFIVQEEALLCLAKRNIIPLSVRQGKKILSNLYLNGKDWFFKRITSETFNKLGQNTYEWADNTDKQEILMFSGSFDPIHLGHIEAAQEGARISGREVWLMPRVHLERRKKLSPIEFREINIRKAIAELPDLYLVPRDLSFRADGTLIGESIEKLEVLSPYSKDQGLIRGSDVLLRSNYRDPKNARRKIFHVISDRDNNAQKRLLQLGLSWPVVTQKHIISSTQLRALLQKGDLDESLQLITPLQAQVLKARNLYKQEEIN